ncbi:MAG: signal peptide peptidase SppA, partial [Opitutaceae bacterium]|nr:signal peptide peptidase SppA [Opitutaceae bacterium]
FVGAIAAIGGGEKATPELERGAYVVFDLSTNITDAPPPIDFGSLGVARDDHLQLRTVTRALRAAAKDERIAGVFVTGGLRPASYGSGYAALSEVRAGIAAVKAAGKPVMAYLTTATTKDYYLASAASEVAIDPYGVIMMSGLASEPMFYAGAFEKYGVGVQVTRVGKYKAAVEPFTRTSMSPENRDQIQKLLNDIWDGILADIAPSRGTTAAQIQAIVDREGFIRPEQAKDGQLVDRIAYRDEVYDELKAKTGRAGSKQPFKQISLGDYARLSKDIADVPAKALEATVSGSGKGRVAVVYAEGEIVDGEGDADEVGGTRFSRELRKLRLDDGVKAVVLRVNSPGGSASASETIQREIRLMKKVKPVVVSMGSYAASGGYWIAAYGDRIFAEPTTITGSIGVFGVQFDVKKLSGDFGLTFDTVKTGKFADVISITRPKSEEELAVFQRMVDWIYGEFIGKVAEARKIKREVVEEIAQGRVWSGVEAKKLGLVDELGGLDAAIASAVAQAKLGPSYRLVEYPHPKELFEAVQELIEKIAPNNVRAPGLAVKLAERIEREVSVLRTFNDPQGVYARLPLNLSLR